MKMPRIKNQVVIILDSDSATPIQIGKMESAPPPPHMIGEAIRLDFTTVVEATMVLIKELDRMSIQSVDTSVKRVIDTLNQEFPGNFTVQD